jgi:hypothetical protein
MLSAIVFATIEAGFVVIWFTSPALVLALFGFATSLIITMVLGVLTTLLFSRAATRAA